MAPSISPSGGSFTGALAGLKGNKGKISIHLDNHYAAKVYTSTSTVAGHVTIDPGPKDLHFEHLQIVLHGSTRTRVDGTRGSRRAEHHFLELHMPIPEESYPVPRVYEADQTYTVPFAFVLPKNLVFAPCRHTCRNLNVQEHHCALPPSIGHWERDDLAPEMVRVAYVLKAKVYRETDMCEPDSPKKKIVTLLETTSPSINVLPAAPGEPPLGIARHDIQYAMSMSKSVRKNLVSPKSGELTVMAIQPAAVMLGADGRAACPTKVTLDFRFDPSTAQSPTPKFLHVGGKVTAKTYFSLHGVGDMPNLGDWVKMHGVESRGEYEAYVGLPDFQAKHVEWKRDPYPRSRRDSGYGSEEPAALGSERRKKAPTPPFSYSATIQMPVELPVQRKAFIPTFHSCMASRVYILALSVLLSPGGSNNTLTVKVKVPLQIGVAPAPRLAPGTRPWVQGRDEPPGYSESR